MPSHFAARGPAIHPGPIGLCSTCTRQRNARRPSRQARGYDTTYDHNQPTVIQLALAAADAGQPLTCPTCQHPCLRGQNLTAGHITDLRNGGTNELTNLAPQHATCNYGWRRDP